MLKKLPKTKLAALDAMIASEDFDSDEARDLDYAIVRTISDDDPDYETLATLDEPQQLFFAAWWVEGEVNNGGFDQFFFNKGPLVAQRAEQFCRGRGLPLVAELVRRAVEVVGPAAMTSHEALQERIADNEDGVSDKLETLGSEFFNLDPYPPFIEARLRFAREHAPSFFGS